MGKRMTISFTPALDSDINDIIKKGMYKVDTKADVIRSGVILYKMILDEAAKGNKLCIVNHKNKIIKEFLMSR